MNLKRIGIFSLLKIGEVTLLAGILFVIMKVGIFITAFFDGIFPGDSGYWGVVLINGIIFTIGLIAILIGLSYGIFQVTQANWKLSGKICNGKRKN